MPNSAKASLLHAAASTPKAKAILEGVRDCLLSRAADHDVSVSGHLADIEKKAGLSSEQCDLLSGELASVLDSISVQSPEQAELVGALIAVGLGGSQAAGSRQPNVQGQLVAPLRGPVVTFLQAICGWLLLRQIARFLGRHALGYARPVAVSLETRGLVIQSSTQLVGKVLRRGESVIPLSSLAHASREVRYGRAGTYAGIAALAIGSFLGAGWLVDGVRAQSFSLALFGLLVVLFGLGLDFFFVSLWPGIKGTCRLHIAVRRGPSFAIAALGTSDADRLLAAISARLQA